MKLRSKKKGFHCGVAFGLMLGFMLIAVGVLSFRVEMVLGGIICGAASALGFGVLFGVCTIVLGFILDAVSNWLNPARRAYIQKMEDLAEHDEDDDFTPPDEESDLRPLPLPESNSTDITPDKDPQL